jgi:hypothetical protein
MKNRVLILSFALLGAASGAIAQTPEPKAAPPAAGSEAEQANALAQALANPVANLWSIAYQFNNYELTNGRFNENLNFQPVMPVSLTKDWNLITRPVIQVYNSAPYTTPTGEEARTTNFGDWTQLELLSPANAGHWLLGLGPSFIFPTAGSIYTGQGKWQVGPALVVAYMTPKFLLGAFPQQWWSFAGDPSRPETSQINIQPIAVLFLEGGWSVGYSGNILGNWKAKGSDRWTVPIGIAVGKVTKFGRLPVKIQPAVQYMVTQPGPVGQRWNFQLMLVPVLPKLIKGTLF